MDEGHNTDNGELPSENAPTPQPAKVKYDLADRTAVFGERVIAFCKTVPKNVITLPLINQLVRSGTSVGANYCEADESVSKKEFCQKIGYCVKEARETKYWLRMMAAAEAETKNAGRELWTEADALHRIFAAIWRKSRS